MRPGARAYDEAELEAYVDGQLGPVRSAEMAAWLTGNPEAQAAAETVRYQNAGLQALFQELLDEEVPARHRDVLRAARKDRSRGFLARIPWPALAAACCLLVAASVTAGWVAHDRIAEREQAEQRIQAFLDQVHSAYSLYSPTAASREVIDEERLEQLLAVLGERLGASLRRPRSEEGYRLVDGRLIPTPGSVAAVFLIRDPEGRPISLYVQAAWEGGAEVAHLAQRDDLSLYYWQEGQLAYALAAQTTSDDLRSLGARFYPSD